MTVFSHRLLSSLGSSCLLGMLGSTNTLLRRGMICVWAEGVDVGRWGWLLNE